jgi:ankyrin repeat protein
MNLHEAIRAGNTTEAINLINEGDDIHVVNKYGGTPLYCAAYYGYFDLVKLLVERGADIEAGDHMGYTPLHMSLYNDEYNTDVVKLLVERGANLEAAHQGCGITPLHMAVNGEHTDMVGFLLDSGANIHAVDKYNETALHKSACKGNTDVVDLLLNRGADTEVRDKDGCTPLHLAVFYGQTDVVNLLVNRGANIEADSNKYGSPVQLAINNKKFQCALSLIKGSQKKFHDLIIPNNSLGKFFIRQWEIAAYENTRKSVIIESIENFINYITKPEEQRRIETSMKDCAKALFGMESTLKAKALLKIKIGALRSGVKGAYVNTLNFLHIFTKFNLLAENINHIIGFVGLYDAPVDLNDILNDLDPKSSRSILGECRTPLSLKQCSTDIKSTSSKGLCKIR